MEQPRIPDIVAFLQTAGRWIGDELELDQLREGDRLLVRTRNTHYLFLMTNRHMARLTTDRNDRPSGVVQIEGCIFGQSRMIKPGHLFCGGGLEFTIEPGHRTFITTPIEAIQLLSARPPAAAPP
ncbi:MAG: hypothetical protein PHE83_14365 [Opitutaceae bacterium]|nr:hypothetical protein [Opitutaceae bacterium]